MIRFPVICLPNKYLLFPLCLSCSVIIIYCVSCLDKSFYFWAGWSPDSLHGGVIFAANYWFTYFCCLWLMFISNACSLASSSICFQVTFSLSLFFFKDFSSSKLHVSLWLFYKYNSVVSKWAYLKTMLVLLVTLWTHDYVVGILGNLPCWKIQLKKKTTQFPSVPYLALVLLLFGSHSPTCAASHLCSCILFSTCMIYSTNLNFLLHVLVPGREEGRSHHAHVWKLGKEEEETRAAIRPEQHRRWTQCQFWGSWPGGSKNRDSRNGGWKFSTECCCSKHF